jgi:hypothetical protein
LIPKDWGVDESPLFMFAEKRVEEND